MGIADSARVLHQTELFGRVPERQLKVIAMMGEELSFNDGERVFGEGDEGDAAYIILSGAVDVVARAGKAERVVATLRRGDIFGELAVLLDQPRTGAIVANGPLVALRLEREHLLNILREFPDIAIQLIRILGRRLIATTSELTRSHGCAADT